MKRVATLFVAAAFALPACGGSDAPELVLPGLAGGDELDMASLRGPAVINLWATWCVPCTEELPDFQRASEEFAHVRFVGVDETGFGEDDGSVSFLDDLGVTYEQYVDTDGSYAAEVEVTELPATLIVDADGDVSYFHQGQVSYDELSDELAGM